MAFLLRGICKNSWKKRSDLRVPEMVVAPGEWGYEEVGSVLAGEEKVVKRYKFQL